MSPVPLRCLVVDDEPIAVEVMERHVQRTPGLELVHATTDAISAFRRLGSNDIDVVFTDIRMPELNGLQLIKLAGDRCGFVIVSAFGEHALDGFELDVADYLLKPVRYERFLSAVEKVRARRQRSIAPDHFFVRSGHENVRIRFDEVLYISAMRDYCAVHTRAKGRILTLENLRDLELRLPQDLFRRIHRSHIVALHAVERAGADQVLIGHVALPISDTYARSFREALDPR
ncbi:MAG TPA: LytTR family DNA-binding domain-containing protein [Flavobacteriales bacterium]